LWSLLQYAFCIMHETIEINGELYFNNMSLTVSSINVFFTVLVCQKMSQQH